jgi:hypothetical protein
MPSWVKPVARFRYDRRRRRYRRSIQRLALGGKVYALDVAFLDQRIPRYERDIINMVGMGVTENAALKPNVKEGAVGFSVTYVGQHRKSPGLGELRIA